MREHECDQSLWRAVLWQNVNDALGIFFNGIIETELESHYALLYKKHVVHRKPVNVWSHTRSHWEVRQARVWMEGSSFDDVCIHAGYDTEFIRRAFAYVQKAIILEKRLLNAIKVANVEDTQAVLLRKKVSKLVKCQVTK